MKANSPSMFHHFIRIGLLSLAAVPLVWGQAPPIDPPNPGEPPRVIIREDDREIETVEPPEPPPVPGIPTAGESGWRIDMRRAGQSAHRAMREVERQVSGMRFGYAGPDARRLLVIPNADTTDDAIAERQNELAIMATILNRAARPDRPRHADVLFEFDGWRSGTGRELEAMLVDGYGAVFLLGVDYPLVKPLTGAEPAAEPKKSADNIWERTRRELLGQGDLDEEGSDDDSESKDRSFSEQRVHELEKRLIESLAHASNIQGLNPDHWIVVQVTGRAPRVVISDSASFTPDGSRIAAVNRRESRGTAVLTLRVKKSAVDEFAAGRTKLEEFSRTVEVSRRVEKPVTKP